MNSGNTRMQKVSRFLDLIKRKGRSGMKHFVDALEFEHPELYKTFTGRDASAGNSDFFLETVKVRYSTDGVNSFQPGVVYHIEYSSLICSANQLVSIWNATLASNGLSD